MQTENRDAARMEPLTRSRAAAVTEAELRAFQELVADLGQADWEQSTHNTGWRVRDVVAHVAGQYEELARIGTFLRRLRTGRRRYPDRIVLDAHNQVQIDELAGSSPTELVTHLGRFGPAGMRALRRMPGLARRLPSTLFFPEPPLPDKSLGYLFDVLTSRDTWMHRLDIARATGRPFAVEEHDRHIVAQVLRDLGRQWDTTAVTLDLTGPAGGRWTLGSGAPVDTIRADAIEMMLHLSGRPGLAMAASSPVAAARVVF
jgi:uncharacterized protein (TIGR03083 family)